MKAFHPTPANAFRQFISTKILVYAAQVLHSMTANREIYVDFLCQIKFQQDIAQSTRAEQATLLETPNKTLSTCGISNYGQ